MTGMAIDNGFRITKGGYTSEDTRYSAQQNKHSSPLQQHVLNYRTTVGLRFFNVTMLH